MKKTNYSIKLKAINRNQLNAKRGWQPLKDQPRKCYNLTKIYKIYERVLNLRISIHYKNNSKTITKGLRTSKLTWL